MPIRNQANNSQPHPRHRRHTGWQAPWRALLDQFLSPPAGRTRTAPHIRDTASVQGLLNNFVIATLPCWLIGLWNTGYQINTVMLNQGLTVAPGWRGAILSGFGIGNDPGNILACWIFGLLYFLPLFLLALLVSGCWELVFARLRNRPLDEGLLIFAWLFTLLLPAGAPLYQAGLGLSFGLVFGKHIFGGTGRYLVNPAVLGAAFLWLAYPELVFGTAQLVPIPDFIPVSALQLAAAGGVDALLAAGLSWWNLFLGVRPGPMGITSVLGSLLGAAYLVLTGSASIRVMAGVLFAAIATVLLLHTVQSSNNLLAVAWHWQLLLGGIVFGAVFLATDPVAGATTNPGRWAYGALVGLLAIIIQATNPSINQAILFAVFLASLCAPLIDFIVIERYLRRQRQRAQSLEQE